MGVVEWDKAVTHLDDALTGLGQQQVFSLRVGQSVQLHHAVNVLGLAQHDHKFGVCQHGIGGVIGKAVLHILRDAGGVGVVLSESLPTCVQEIGAQRIAQQQIDFVKVHPCGCFWVIAFVAHHGGIDVLQHGQHGNGFKLLTQTLDVEADQAVAHIHICRLGEHLHTAGCENFQCKCQFFGTVVALTVQRRPQILDGRARRCVFRFDKRFVNAPQCAVNQTSISGQNIFFFHNLFAQAQHKLCFCHIGRDVRGFVWLKVQWIEIGAAIHRDIDYLAAQLLHKRRIFIFGVYDIKPGLGKSKI